MPKGLTGWNQFSHQFTRLSSKTKHHSHFTGDTVSETSEIQSNKHVRLVTETVLFTCLASTCRSCQRTSRQNAVTHAGQIQRSSLSGFLRLHLCQCRIQQPEENHHSILEPPHVNHTVPVGTQTFKKRNLMH